MTSFQENHATERQIYSISELNRKVRGLLEDHLPPYLGRGEISNFARPASGHWYLSLKDDQAQVRCAMFRNANQRVLFNRATAPKYWSAAVPGFTKEEVSIN